LVLQIVPHLTALLTEIPFKLIDRISLNVGIRAASLTLHTLNLNLLTFDIHENKQSYCAADLSQQSLNQICENQSLRKRFVLVCLAIHVGRYL